MIDSKSQDVLTNEEIYIYWGKKEKGLWSAKTKEMGDEGHVLCISRDNSSK